MPSKPQTSVRLPKDTREQLEWLAQALGMTKTTVLVIAVRELFKANKGEGK